MKIDYTMQRIYCFFLTKVVQIMFVKSSDEESWFSAIKNDKAQLTYIRLIYLLILNNTFKFTSYRA